MRVIFPHFFEGDLKRGYPLPACTFRNAAISEAVNLSEIKVTRIVREDELKHMSVEPRYTIKV